MKGLTGKDIAILSLIVGILAAGGFFNQADIRTSAQTGYSSCPSYFYGSFKTMFSNLGNAVTDLCVNVSSEVIEFKSNTACFAMGINYPNPTPFTFYFKSNNITDSRNVSISYTWNYKKSSFMPYTYNTRFCRYTSQYGNLVLIEGG